MAEGQNLLSTPENYATPEQLRSTQEYAKALLNNSQKPIQHWTQGVSNMVSALVGGMLNFNANRKENEANAVDAGRMLSNIPDRAGPSFSQGPAPAGLTNPGDTLGRASKAIAGIESGGDYSSVGPATKTGDKAYGKYQVMGNNIPEWTTAALGKPMTPDEFLKNPDAQEAVFKHKFGEYTTKYGPQGAAKAWFAGEGGMNNPNAKDQLGTTVDGYGKKFAMGFAGPDGSSAPPAVQAMSSALRGSGDAGLPPDNVQVAAAAKPQAGPPGASVMPNPNAAAGTFVDPSLVQRRPQLNEGQMRGILASPRISEQAKMQFLQQYQQQDQPISVPYPGGTVIIDPRDPRRQQFIPDLQKGTTKLGDMERSTLGTVNGQGQYVPTPVVPSPTIGPRSDAGGAAPVVAPAVAPGPGVAPVQAAVPAAPAAPTPAPEAVPNTGGVQVASNDPTAGVGSVSPAATPVAAAAPAATPLAKFAQAVPLGATPEQLKLQGFSPADVADYTNKKAYDNKVALEQEAGKAKISVDAEAEKDANKAYAKKYDEMQSGAQAAAEQQNNIRTARAMLADKNFYAGLGSGVVENWKRLKSALGVDPDAAAPMEVFKKTTAQSIMTGLKQAFGGLGQIRVAEIRLQEIANASTNNTPTAIKALLEISDRNAAKAQELGEMSAAYKTGEEVRDPHNPDKVLVAANIGPDGQPRERVGLDAKFDRIMHQYNKEHPTFTKDEYDTFIKDLNGNPAEKELPKGGAAVVTPPPGGFQTPPPGAINILKANPGSREMFEKRYGPADKYLK